MNRTAAYSRSAQVYDALNRGKNYERASQSIIGLIDQIAPQATTLLDVGCGTGRHLEHLRRRFRVEGLDASPSMLKLAERRCPGIRLHNGSLLDFRLQRRFDVITCLFGSIAYASTIAGLAKAVKTLAHHLQPDGLLILEPWIAPTRFVVNALVCDTADDPDFKVARVYVTRRQANAAVLDVHYLVARKERVTNFREQHRLGLYSDDDYRRLFRTSGLVVRATANLFGYGTYVCRKTSIRQTDNARRRPV